MLKRVGVLATVLILFCASACQTPGADSAAGTAIDLAITNVTVIDAVGGARPSQTVLLRGDNIVAVVPASDKTATAQATAAARVVDGSGRFVIPGLWDMHVHITYEKPLTRVMPELFLAYGITSVRDTGGLLHELAPEVKRWRAPNAVAPRLYFSGPLLDGARVVYDGDGRPEIGIANPTQAAARASIARLKAAGVDFVKIYELVDPLVFDALVRAARNADLPIAAHVPLALAARDAGPRVDSMEHLRNIEMDCSRTNNEQLRERQARIAQPGAVSGYELRRALHAEHRPRSHAVIDAQQCNAVIAALRNTIQVPTLRLNTIALHPPFARDDFMQHVARLPQPARQTWSKAASDWLANPQQLDPTNARWSLDLVGQLHAAGVPVGAGTDTPIGWALPGYSLHTELERLVQAGLSPAAALAAATLRPAEFLGIESATGQIRPGFAADLVLLDGNPLQDIRNTRRINTVISKGRIVDR